MGKTAEHRAQCQHGWGKSYRGPAVRVGHGPASCRSLARRSAPCVVDCPSSRHRRSVGHDRPSPTDHRSGLGSMARGGRPTSADRRILNRETMMATDASAQLAPISGFSRAKALPAFRTFMWLVLPCPVHTKRGLHTIFRGRQLEGSGRGRATSTIVPWPCSLVMSIDPP